MAYKIQKFSKISGVTPSNLRFYEQKGYPGVERTANGYRQYTVDNAYQMNTFHSLLAQGFSIAEAVEMLGENDREEYLTALREHCRIMEEERWLLEERIRWNKKMQYVYGHLEEELQTARRITLPDLYFLKCSEGNRLEASYANDAGIAGLVKLLPVSCFAERFLAGEQSELGIMIPVEVARERGLELSEYTRLPGGDYDCFLIKEYAGEEELRKDERVKTYLREVGQLPEPLYAIYIMVGIKGFGEFMNYILLKMPEKA